MSYRKCELCGCSLDYGEKCDCQEVSAQLEKKYEQLTSVSEDGQIKFGGIGHELCTG